MMSRYFFVIAILTITVFSCTKWEDPSAVNDERLNRPYCNDPEAVNYNWDFPGVPDNSKCFFPTDVFNGTYTFTDSVFSSDLEYDTFHVYNISLQPQSKTAFLLTGYCWKGYTANSILKFTADRYYKASADSLMLQDSTKIKGQLICSTTDTLNGTIIKDPSNENKLRLNFTVYSDTGTFLHIGSAIKQ